MVCVWPLVEGLEGVDGTGARCTLATRRRGWMTEAAAHAAREAGDVQFMAGISPSDLQAPRIKPALAETVTHPTGRKKQRYRRADIHPESS